MTQVVDNFVAITHSVIADDGFEEYLPTLLLPGKREVLVLEGAPTDKTLPAIARRWAIECAGKKADFVLAYKSDKAHFIVLARIKGALLERIERIKTPNKSLERTRGR